jgi:DNA-binding Lrp family transcriptional regulator
MIEDRWPARRIEGARDALDERLIALLRRNARMTLTALARELALSRTAVQARMARLERDGVILGYRAEIAPRAAGEETLSAILTITFTQRPCEPVVAKFRDWPEIDQYFSVTGPQDAYLVVTVAGPQELSRLVDRLSAIPGVGPVRSAVVLKSSAG